MLPNHFQSCASTHLVCSRLWSKTLHYCNFGLGMCRPFCQREKRVCGLQVRIVVALPRCFVLFLKRFGEFFLQPFPALCFGAGLFSYHFYFMARPPLPRAELSTSLGQDVFLSCLFCQRSEEMWKNTPHFGPHVRKCITSWGNTNPSTTQKIQTLITKKTFTSAFQFSPSFWFQNPKKCCLKLRRKKLKIFESFGSFSSIFFFQTPIFSNFPQNPKKFLFQKTFFAPNKYLSSGAKHVLSINFQNTGDAWCHDTRSITPYPRCLALIV